MYDDDPNEEQQGEPEESGFVPESSSPPMDAPELQSLNLKGAKVRETSSPLLDYVSREDPDATPVLRDTPFGNDAPGIFGGETPFFQSTGGAGFDFEMDDTEGIPTGLPNLIDLPPAPDLADIDEWVPVTEDLIPERSQPVMVQRVLGVDPTPPAPPPVDEEAEKAKLRYQQMVAFSIGVLVTSLLWGVLLFLSLQT